MKMLISYIEVDNSFVSVLEPDEDYKRYRIPDTCLYDHSRKTADGIHKGNIRGREDRYYTDDELVEMVVVSIIISKKKLPPGITSAYDLEKDFRMSYKKFTGWLIHNLKTYRNLDLISN